MSPQPGPSETVEGWLTDAQAERLRQAAAGVSPPGRIVEIGSFRGRSTIALAHAAPAGVEVVAIDPHAGSDRGPQEISADARRGDADHDAFRANLERAGVAGRVRHIREFSHAALEAVEGPIDVLYVDGAHRFGPARDDIVRWGDRVVPGGRLLVHDSFSSVGVTLALISSTFASTDLRYVGRTGSLAEYVRSPVRGRARLRNAGRQVASLPWFARNVLVKVAILGRLDPLLRMLGHQGRDWPY